MRHFVYALIKEGEPVYVGCTSSLTNRDRQHRKTKDFDNTIVLSIHKSRKEALIAERSIITFLETFPMKGILNCSVRSIFNYQNPTEAR